MKERERERGEGDQRRERERRDGGRTDSSLNMVSHTKFHYQTQIVCLPKNIINHINKGIETDMVNHISIPRMAFIIKK